MCGEVVDGFRLKKQPGKDSEADPWRKEVEDYRAIEHAVDPKSEG